jgi:hypothetical protein
LFTNLDGRRSILVEPACISLSGRTSGCSGRWFVAFPLFGSVTGLVVAPLAGWRYGRAAASGQRAETWAAHALGFAVAAGLALWGAYIVGCVVLLGVPGDSANVAPFIGFAAFESSVYVLLGTGFVTISLGCLWVTLLRLLGPSAAPPASAR